MRHLRAFQEVARHLNFRAAARELAVSQPALSAAIHELEGVLDTPLFERSSHHVALTAAGRVLLPQAEWVVNNFRHGVEDMHRSLVALSLSLRVGMLPSLLAIGVPALAQWQRQFPSVRLVLHDFVNRDLVAQVLSGGIDIALGADTDLPDSVATTPVGRDELVALIAPGHWLAAHEGVAWRDLQGERLALFTSMSTYDLALSTLRQQGLHLDLAFQMLYRESILTLVQHGMAVGVMSHLYAHDAQAWGLRTVRLRQPAITRRVVLMRREGPSAVHTAATSCFTHLRGALRAHDGFPPE